MKQHSHEKMFYPGHAVYPFKSATQSKISDETIHLEIRLIDTI